MKMAAAIIVFVFLLFILVVMGGGCAYRAFYYPDAVLRETPAQHGMKFEPVTFSSGDGTRLTGWFLPATTAANPREAKGTVIHFHGNAQNMTAHWQFVRWLPARGFNVFVFDYRGYGASAGKPGPKGLWRDSQAAIDCVRVRPDVDPERLLVFGQSLGGTNALAAVGGGDRAGIRAVAIEAAFYSYTSIANDKLPGAGWLLCNRYGAAKHIAQISPIPLLLIHGTADSVIPESHSARLFAKAGEPKQLVIIPGSAHIDAMTEAHGGAYRDLLVAFFEAALAAPAAH
ncbi:alpha/beta hydrolase [Termitidicoccus mucosus]|uniref:Alpha/beta hydrolase n=2 Tax=Termitidicoccus mucosus TaxID=1184151 RepID=A0A178IR86_9BACT|nr:alpha/beta hydrolase [Opitutaceae bacterium TSB47]